jgi:hypothetical protein
MRVILVFVVLSVVLIPAYLVADSQSAGYSRFQTEPVDSAAETRVRYLREELANILGSVDESESGTIGMLVFKSDAGQIALRNFKAMRELERSRVQELILRGDSGMALEDEELGFIVYSMAENVYTIEKSVIVTLQELASTIERPAVAQAARDLASAWQVIRDAMLRKSPLLKRVVESGVLET